MPKCQLFKNISTVFKIEVYFFEKNIKLCIRYFTHFTEMNKNTKFKFHELNLFEIPFNIYEKTYNNFENFKQKFQLNSVLK